MTGGVGDDIYIVDNAGDMVSEHAGEGIDGVRKRGRLHAGADVEKLILTGSGDVDGTGNVLANILIGNVGNNRLDGGVGADTMSGGLGGDTYVVDNFGDEVIEVDVLRRHRHWSRARSASSWASMSRS